MLNKHTFVILAYKESSFLEECILSLLKQSVSENIIIATSTRNEFIDNIAKKYNLEIVEKKEGEKGIAFDFDFALFSAQSKYVTIAHQDDVYDEKYLENVLKKMDDETLIAFTDCYELKGSEIERSNVNLRIKRALLFLLKFKLFQSRKFFKRLTLSFGNPICCPSVTFNHSLIEQPLFVSGFKSNVDWYAWEKLSKKDGKFVYIDKSLILHRIHGGSTTSGLIADNARTVEDFEMFVKFWPSWIAKIIAKIYKRSEKNNG